MAKILNRVKVATATTGTGTITLGSAASGYQSVSAAGGVNGDVLSYVIEDGSDWEIGTGTYTSAGTTLSRTLVQSSTGSLINLSGSANVFVAPSSADMQALSFGDSGLSYNSTNKSLTVGGATVTTSNPVLNLSQTWNAGAVTFKGIVANFTNTASAATSVFIDLQLSGATKFQVRASDGYVSSGTGFASQYYGMSASGFVAYHYGSTMLYNTSEFYPQTGALRWGTGGNTAYLYCVSANRITMRNGTNAQTLDVAGTYTDASNYRRISIAMTTAGIGTIAPEGAGTGASGNILAFVTGGTTVASLPAASSALTGARLFVTDANATTFLSTVAGGGANKVPVVCDGTNWLIG